MMPSRRNQLLRLVVRRLPDHLRSSLLRERLRHPAIARFADRVTQPLREGVHTIEAGAGAGLVIDVAGSYVQYVTGTAEPDVQKALGELLQPGDVALDVGSNVGFFTLIMARLVGPSGTVVAVDPVPANARAVGKNARLNGFSNIRVCEVAATDRPGEVELLVSETSAFSRVAGLVRDDNVASCIVVEGRPLDDLIDGREVPVPSLVKIDIEGAEIAALRGLERSLRRHRPKVLCELHGTNAEFVQLMERLDYAVSGVHGEDVRTAHWNVHALAVPADAPRIAAP
jgi:FkbM family methyltransferase